MIWFLTGAYQNFTMVSKFAKNVTSEKCNVTFRVPKDVFQHKLEILNLQRTASEK